MYLLNDFTCTCMYITVHADMGNILRKYIKPALQTAWFKSMYVVA